MKPLKSLAAAQNTWEALAPWCSRAHARRTPGRRLHDRGILSRLGAGTARPRGRAEAARAASQARGMSSKVMRMLLGSTLGGFSARSSGYGVVIPGRGSRERTGSYSSLNRNTTPCAGSAQPMDGTRPSSRFGGDTAATATLPIFWGLSDESGSTQLGSSVRPRSPFTREGTLLEAARVCALAPSSALSSPVRSRRTLTRRW